jgi:hypothetical protein
VKISLSDTRAYSSVIPWHLWIVSAHASFNGTYQQQQQQQQQ